MFFVVPCSRLLLDMLCHHTFSLLCPRSRERTSPENQQSNPWLPTKTKVPVEVMERMTKLKLQKALLKSLGRSIYSLLHLPTKSKHKVFVPNKQTNSSPTTKQPNKTKKTSTTLSPYILLTVFAMLFIIYIYILHHQVQPRSHWSHQVEAFGSTARWLPVNASLEVSGAKLWCRFRARRKKRSTKP